MNLSMKVGIISFLMFLSTGTCFAADWSKVEANDFKSLSFNKAQSVRHVYIKFLKRVEKTQQFARYKGEEFTSYKNVEQIYNAFSLVAPAYAADGDVCFFGGWPSKLKDNLCEGPWHHRNSSQTNKALGGGYTKSFSCKGGPQYFRCNPVVFGVPVPGVNGTENGVDIDLNHTENGYCVDTKGSYIELSKKCELASKKSIESQVAEIQSESKEGEERRKQLEAFHQSIFGKDGKSGFCGNYRSSKGEVYDACDDLQKRLNELGIPFEIKPKEKLVKEKDPIPTVEENLITGEFITVSPPENLYGEGMSVMEECQRFLEKNSSDDIRGRRIIQSLHGGMAACNKGQQSLPGISLTESGLEKLNDSFDKAGYLKKLNLKNFKSIVQALMVSELSFMNTDGDFPETKLLTGSKADFKERIKERFPRIKEKEFSDAFDEIYAKVMESKENIPQNTYKSSISAFEALADNNTDSVNKTCGAIHEEYNQRFGDRKRWYGLDWTRKKSQDELKFINEKKQLLRGKIDHVYSATNMGFLLGTDHFKKYVMDPSADFVQTCMDEKEHMVIKPNIQKSNYQAALVNAREMLLESFSKISDGRFGINNTLSISTANSAIEDYLKTDRKIVLETILKAKGEEQIKLAKFLCFRTMDIYDSDESLQYFGVLGGGLMSLAGAISCAVPLGWTQLVGCPAAKVGASIAVASSGYKASEAIIESKRLDLNMAKGTNTSSYLDEKKRSTAQLNQAGVELGLASLPLLAVTKTAPLINKGQSVTGSPGTTIVPFVPKNPVSEKILLEDTVKKIGVKSNLPQVINSSKGLVPNLNSGKELGGLILRPKGQLSTNVFRGGTKRGPVTLEGEYTVVSATKLVSAKGVEQIIKSLIPVANQVTNHNKNRDDFKKLKLINTLPSEVVDKDFINLLSEENNDKVILKSRARQKLKILLNLDKNTTDGELLKLIKILQGQLDSTPHELGSPVNNISKDELRRLEILIKLAFEI